MEISGDTIANHEPTETNEENKMAAIEFKMSAEENTVVEVSENLQIQVGYS